MTVIIPDAFENDIQGKHTNIFPILEIHTSSALGWDLYYSTNKLTFDGIYWQPLLLSIPLIKEKLIFKQRNL